MDKKDKEFLEMFRPIEGVYQNVDPDFHKYLDEAFLATKQYVTQPRLEGNFDYSWLPPLVLRIIRDISTPTEHSPIKLESEVAVKILDDINFDDMVATAIVDLTKLAEETDPAHYFYSIDMEAELSSIYSDSVVAELAKDYL